MSRGGARNTGLVMANNTSRLNSIGFKWYHGKKRGRGKGKSKPTVHVTVAVGSKRLARSVDANGEVDALRQVIKLRKDAGLPAPTLRMAQQALQAFLETKP